MPPFFKNFSSFSFRYFLKIFPILRGKGIKRGREGLFTPAGSLLFFLYFYFFGLVLVLKFFFLFLFILTFEKKCLYSYLAFFFISYIFLVRVS